MKKIKFLVMIMIISSMVAGCDKTPEVEETGNQNETVTVDNEEEVTDKVTEEVEAVIEETEDVIDEVKDLPDLYNEEAYFALVKDYYEKLNVPDVEGLIDLTYYTPDDDGVHDKKVDTRIYNNLSQSSEYNIPTGIQTFLEPVELTEADGSISYRARLIYMLQVINRMDNGEFEYSEYNEGQLVDQHRIYLMTIAYDSTDLKWKVLEDTSMATVRVRGEKHMDWEKYRGASREDGGWIVEYGDWYNEEFPIEE